MQEHVLDDRICALAVLHDLVEVAADVDDQPLGLRAPVLAERRVL
jgi:hypothetical protein